MQLSHDFTLEELVISQIASRAGINNSPATQNIRNLERLAKELLQPIRDLLDCPVIVSSGFRCERVNQLAGGSDTSAHSYGFAADITAPKFGTPKNLALYLAHELPKRGIKFDQIIFEFGDWVHVAIFNRAMLQRGQVLTARKAGKQTQYFQGVV